MVSETPFLTSRSHSLMTSLYGGDLASGSPLVVYLHGFKGFKDWGFVPFLGKSFVENGIRLLAMNFSHNGIGEDRLNFTEPEKFRRNTFSLELSEALEVLEAASQGAFCPVEEGASLGLIGHSRGGGIAVLAGEQSPHVSAVCTWSAVATFRRYPAEVIERWRQEGELEVKNARTGQVMYMDYEIHRDLMEHLDGKLGIERAAKQIGKPLRVVHGADDPVVLPDDAHQLAGWAGAWGDGPYLVKGAGHTFGAGHPFSGSNPMLDEAVGLAVDFFNEHLN